MVIQSLGPKVFETSAGESLEQKLANVTEEKLEKSIHATGKNITKRTVTEKKEELNRLQNKVKKCLLFHLFHLGQSTALTSINDVVSRLTVRDYPQLEYFDGTQTLKIFIPEIFFNNCPSIIGPEEYMELRQALENNYRVIMK